MAAGILKFYKQTGFGFIKPDDGGVDIFAHIKEFKKAGFKGEPEIGQRLQFDVEQGERGPRAVNIVLV